MTRISQNFDCDVFFPYNGTGNPNLFNFDVFPITYVSKTFEDAGVLYDFAVYSNPASSTPVTLPYPEH